MVQGDLHTEREPLGDRRLVFMSLTDRKGVLSYVVEDKDAKPADFWATNSGVGAFLDERGERFSLDAPEDGDRAFSVVRRKKDGAVSFEAEALTFLFAGGPVGIYYSPEDEQAAFRETDDEKALMESANAYLAEFAAFVNGPVCAIVQEIWELGEDGRAVRTHTQMTTSCNDYEAAWDMVADDQDAQFEGVGLDGM